MSVEIQFDLYKAQEAGAEIQYIVEKWDESYEEDTQDINYYKRLGWRMPHFMEYYCQADVFEPSTTKEPIKISVTSRRYHQQITDWLKSHNIEYGEI